MKTGALRLAFYRLGSGVGLALCLAVAWGAWGAGIESFAEGLAEGLFGVAFAVVVTVIALALVYAALGAWVESVVTQLLAIASRRASDEVAGAARGLAGAVADGIAMVAYAVFGVAMAAWGVGEARASTALMGFSTLALAAFAGASAIVHLVLYGRLRRKAVRVTSDDTRIAKGGEVAGVFVSAAVVSLVVSAAVFASLPHFRYRGVTRPLAHGDWANVCIGEAPGCEPEKTFSFSARGEHAITLEWVGDELPLLLDGKGQAARDAAGVPITLRLEPDSTISWSGSFTPRPGELHRLVIAKQGYYQVRFRRAR
ncbi:MAG: hypothetical protein KF718_15375 [Polyangiaceae bacterium]|nr:hypothetical protein [Polyangiaceae bacterium]